MGNSIGSNGIPLDPMEFHWIQWNSIGSNGIPLDPMEFHWQKDRQVGQKPWQLAKAFPSWWKVFCNGWNSSETDQNGSQWLKTVTWRLRGVPNGRKPGPGKKKK